TMSSSSGFAWGRYFGVPTVQTLGPPTGAPGVGAQIAVNPSKGDGEPVNTATGSFYTSAIDLSLPGTGVPFVFTRSYNSLDASTGRFGVGWKDNLNWTLTDGGSYGITVRSGVGQQLHFTNTAGIYTADAGGRATLSTRSGGGYELVNNDQTHYVFDSSGKLTGETDRNGQGLALSYDSGGNLQTITDSAGRSTSVTTSSGKVTAITLPD